VSAADPKPRRPPREMPDSLPDREQGTDVAPDQVRDPERPARGDPPDSLPRNEEETTRP
jgi:hypothetical protein